VWASGSNLACANLPDRPREPISGASGCNDRAFSFSRALSLSSFSFFTPPASGAGGGGRKKKKNTVSDLPHRQHKARKVAIMDVFIFVCVALLQVVLYCAVRCFLFPTSSPSDTKSRAWVLSLLVSGLFSSVVYILVAFPGLQAAYNGVEVFREFTAGEQPMHRYFTLYFLAFLVLDCVIGVLDYPQHLRIDTTWIHHIVISVFLVMFLGSGTCVVFLLCAPFEIPTFAMSLGSIFPSYRNDCESECHPQSFANLSGLLPQ
jgi:hypothetical protein